MRNRKCESQATAPSPTRPHGKCLREMVGIGVKHSCWMRDRPTMSRCSVTKDDFIWKASWTRKWRLPFQSPSYTLKPVKFLKYCFYFESLYIWYTCRTVHHMHAWCLWSPEEDVATLDSGVKNSCKSLCGCWDWNPGPLDDQPGHLIAESSL